MARFFKNVGAAILVFLAIYLPIGMFAFMLGESTYGMEDRAKASFYADIANSLADIRCLVVVAIISIVFVQLMAMRKKPLPWKAVYVCASFVVGIFFQMFAVGYPYHTMLALIACVPGVVLLFVRRRG